MGMIGGIENEGRWKSGCLCTSHSPDRSRFLSGLKPDPLGQIARRKTLDTHSATNTRRMSLAGRKRKENIAKKLVEMIEGMIG